MNNVDMQYAYTSSNGAVKDVREMNTEYMINALAKANREFYSDDADISNRCSVNIAILEQELSARRDKFLSEKANASSEGGSGEAI